MCNCRENMINKFKEMYPDATSVLGQYEMLSGRPYSEVTIQLKDKKKPIKRLLLHSFCPMCGRRLEESECRK